MLVFVQLGEGLPKYLESNLARSRSLFPDLSIVLAAQTAKAALCASRHDVDFISLDSKFGNPDLAQKGIARDGFDLDLWSGYWQKTFDRLLALSEIHEQLGQVSLLHIEGDVILMPEFPFQEISTSETLLWAGFDNENDIASILYSPDISSSKWLASELASVAKTDDSLSDMTALREVRRKSPHKVELFPMLPGDSETPWVFDGLQFGDWLFGWDPKAHWGFKKKRMKTSNYSEEVSRSSFELDENRLIVKSSKGLRHIACLHVHSKEHVFFQSNISKHLERLIVSASRQKRFYGFVPSAFVSWGISRIRRWSKSVWSLSSWKALLFKR